MSQDNRELVEGIVENYYGQIKTLIDMGKNPDITLKEYLEGVMLTEPDVYDADDLRYGLKYGARLKE